MPPMNGDSAALAIALAHHQAGRLPEAEALYRQILGREPGNAQAWHLLGVAQYQRGELAAAAESLGRAVALEPNAPAFHCNLGNVRQALNQPDQAAGCYRRSLALNPNHIEALNNLGTVLESQGAREEAVACYRKVLSLKPELPRAHNNLGLALEGLGQRGEALACFRRALELDPGYAEAHYHLGNALREERQVEDAVASYRRAVQLRPDFSQAHGNLGNVLKEQGRLDEAIAHLRKALALSPDHAETHYNLGNVLKEQGRLDEAAGRYRRALALRPDYPEAVCALAHELEHLCEWPQVAALARRVIESVEHESVDGAGAAITPFSFMVLPVPTTAEQQWRCARQWARRRFDSLATGRGSLAAPREASSKKRRTIGYLSADFHAHATAMLIAELFEKHDRSRFEIIAYSYGHQDAGAMRQRLASALDRFVDVKDLSPEQTAKRIAHDEVDILVDLKGYTQHARSEILALRPAPIQVNYLGYPGTMGADFMDYILVDDFIVPPGQQPYFSERLVHLPGCYQVNDSRRAIAERTPSRGQCDLPDQGFVYCSFNNNYKITPEIFDVWMRLLAAVEGSVLWLFEANRFAADNLRREALARGVAAERLVFAPRLEPAEHLARHRLADLFLDTAPINAHTTASDALWAGCPVLTIAGQTFVARVAGSLLRTLDLPELIATNLAEYEATALRLTRDPRALAALRDRLAANRTTSSLFDAGQFARHLEQAYDTMYEIHRAGQAPRAFAVEAMNR